MDKKRLHQREKWGLIGGVLCVGTVIVGALVAVGLLVVAGSLKCPGKDEPETRPSVMADQKYLQASDNVAGFYVNHMSKEGQNTSPDAPGDVCIYYKLPTLLLLAGKHQQANAVLDYIKTHFLQQNGDFRTSVDKKTDSGALNEYYAYINGWIGMAALRLGRFDIANPAFRYTDTYFHDGLGGFTTQKPHNGTEMVDILSTSHFGLADLYRGNVERAKRAGELIKRFVDSQKNMTEEFYLRMDSGGDLITSYPEDMTPFYVVKIKEPNQLYFMVGYPIAFLAKLYQATGDESFLSYSRKLLEFLLVSHESIFKFNFAHKVAWAAAVVARLTGEPKYAEFAKRIADFLLTQQDKSGVFLAEAPPIDRFDQSAELGVWLREIQTELNLMSNA